MARDGWRTKKCPNRLFSDVTHVNAEGAELFTRTLAEEFSEVYGRDIEASFGASSDSALAVYAACRRGCPRAVAVEVAPPEAAQRARNVHPGTVRRSCGACMFDPRQRSNLLESRER